jgi:hypothetical protein
LNWLLSFCQWMQDTTFSTSVRESIWIFPLIETTHVMGLSLSVGTIALIDLRLLGFTMKKIPITEVSRQILPWALKGFVIMFVTGILLFLAQPLKAYNSIFFYIKMALIALAGINALVYEVTIHPGMVDWDNAPVPPFRARLVGALSLILWIGVVTAGRTMAYKF